MKIIILKNNIKKGLEIIEKITGKNLTLPILNNVLFSTENNLLKLSGTDLEIGIKHWILCKTEKQGEIAIPAKFAYNLINYLPEEKINLESKNKILSVECKNYKSQIKSELSEDFPIIPKIEAQNFIEINSALFCQALSQVKEFSTQNQTRPELSGVYFIFKENKLKMVATDSFRLAEKTINFDKKINKEYSFILPQKTAFTLINIFSEKQGKLRIYFSANQIQFETNFQEIQHPEVQVISRLIEGEYPNYQEIIPKDFETQVVLDKNKLLNQIKTASLFTEKINEIKIKIIPDENKVEIFSQSPELGENYSCLPAEISGKKMNISFNWKYLLDGLAYFKSSEIIIGLNKEDSPIIIKPKGDQSYFYILMPIRNI
ncbi:MAG: DNA polymerase III subunit beta [Patescibacteria group bacterium]|nr:DNA polymerase III subunit beta [Patescibacteria group bacterium]